MKITDKLYFDEYKQLIGNDLQRLVEKFESAQCGQDLSYETMAAAVYSSNIDGNTVDLESFMNYKRFKTKSKPKQKDSEIEIPKSKINPKSK